MCLTSLLPPSPCCSSLRALRSLSKQIRDYLNIFEDQPPTISVCEPRVNNGGYQSNTSIKNHVTEITDIIKFKCNGNETISQQLHGKLWDLLQEEIYEHFQLKLRLTTMNCNVLQDILRASDARWRLFANKIHDALGWKFFRSERDKQSLRKILKPSTNRIFEIDLAVESTNQYNPLPVQKFLVSVIEETEIVAQSFDNAINNNKYVELETKFHGKLWFQLGGDKATKGGYSESICLVGGDKFSVTNSMCNLYVPGQMQESPENIARIRHYIKEHFYDKSRVWEGLSIEPVVVSVVLYSVDEKRELNSRFVHSCVVFLHPEAQQSLDIDEAKVEENAAMQPRPEWEVDRSIFVTEAEHMAHEIELKCRRRGGREAIPVSDWKCGWEIALDDLTDFEAKYERPRDLGYMSEKQRHGDFTSCMCICC